MNLFVYNFPNIVDFSGIGIFKAQLYLFLRAYQIEVFLKMYMLDWYVKAWYL